MANNSKAQRDAQRHEMAERLRREEEARKKKESRVFIYAMVAIFLVAVVVVAIVIGGAIKNNKKPETTTAATTTALEMKYPDAPKMEALDFSTVEDFSRFAISETATDYVAFNVTYTDDNGLTRAGDIVVRLYENVAPITVAHFKELVAAKTYDGMIFHRVIKDFMVQAGGFLADGSYVEPNSTIKGEFSSNGYYNHLEHVRGVISMARGDNANDSASAQFFIVHKTSPHLDGNYAAFGFTVYGMDTVDAIAIQSTNSSDKPLNNVVINTARFVTLNPAA